MADFQTMVQRHTEGIIDYTKKFFTYATHLSSSTRTNVCLQTCGNDCRFNSRDVEQEISFDLEISRRRSIDDVSESLRCSSREERVRLEMPHRCPSMSNASEKRIFVANSNRCKETFGKCSINEDFLVRSIFVENRNVCPFLNLCSAMLSSSLNEIQHEAIGQFHLAEITFLTDLHLSDFDSSFDSSSPFLLSLIVDVFSGSNASLSSFVRRLFRSVSIDSSSTSADLLASMEESLRIGHVSQRYRQVRRKTSTRGVRLRSQCTSHPLHSFAEIRLTSQCEKCGEELYAGLQEKNFSACRCQKQSTADGRLAFEKASPRLAIKGHGFLGTTQRTGVLPFELIFAKDPVYKEEMKKILDEFRLSFDELDQYCESNQWLCEINRFCLQWTPNQMKQMSEGKQVFLIEVEFSLSLSLTLVTSDAGTIESSSWLDRQDSNIRIDLCHADSSIHSPNELFDHQQRSLRQTRTDLFGLRQIHLSLRLDQRPDSHRQVPSSSSSSFVRSAESRSLFFVNRSSINIRRASKTSLNTRVI